MYILIVKFKTKVHAVFLFHLSPFESKKYDQQTSYIRLKLLLIDSLAYIGKDTTSTSLSEIQFHNGRTYSCSLNTYTGPVLGTTYDAFTLSGNH